MRESDVPISGVEPETLPVSEACSNQLRYIGMKFIKVLALGLLGIREHWTSQASHFNPCLVVNFIPSPLAPHLLEGHLTCEDNGIRTRVITLRKLYALRYIISSFN